METKQELEAGTEERTRVLLVDDEECIRTALARGLRRLGCETMDANGGEDGLQLAASYDPHVIFLDLRMPGIDGHTFLRRLPAVNPNAAVIVMSGHGGMDDVVDVLRAGAIDYLKKPWSATDIAAALTRAIDVSGLRRQNAGRSRDNQAGASPPAAPAPTTNQTAASLSTILQRVKSGDMPVPSVPTILARVRALLMAPSTDLDALVEAVEKDQRLVADLVRSSNTVQYSRGGRNTSVRMAITRIGFRQVHTRVETLILKGLYPSRNPNATKVLSALWRQSVARALSMRGLADVLAGNDEINPDVAYLAGLFNDIGASFLVWILAERDPNFVDDAGLRETLSNYHQEMSALVLDRWDFDAGLVNLVRTHHNDSPPSENAVYWEMSVLANDLARKITNLPDPTFSGPENSGRVERCAASLQIGDRALSQLLGPLKAEFNTFMADHV